MPLSSSGLITRHIFSGTGSDSHRYHTRVVVTSPEHVRLRRVAVTVRGHRKGHADVQFCVRHRRGPRSASGRIRVQGVRPNGQHDVVRRVPVGRLGHAGVSHFRLDAVRRPDDPGNRGGSPVCYHTIVHRRDSRASDERCVALYFQNTVFFCSKTRILIRRKCLSWLYLSWIKRTITEPDIIVK